MKIKFSTIIPLVLISAIVLTAGCNKEVIYPIIPVINYNGYVILKSVSGIDSALKLTISYTDGDGDLGLQQGDLNPPFDSGSIYYYNLYVYYYEFISGVWSQVTLNDFSTDTIRFKYRFPYLTPNANNKAIKGDIEYTITNLIPRKSHTIMFKFYIYDRMLHKSNVDSTGAITF